MEREPGQAPRGLLLQWLGRPVLVVFWALILWGTLYGSLLVYAAVAEGPAVALRRALSGRDVLGGVLNLGLAGCAVVVWSLVGVVAWRCKRSAGGRSQDGHDELS